MAENTSNEAPPVSNSIAAFDLPGAFEPLLARTSTIHRAIGPVAYDCVKFIVVRDGSAFLFSEFGQQPVKPGDVVVLGANVLCGSEPEGHITVTTIYVDTDYVLDQVRWQYAGILQDRLDAQTFANTIYTEPAQILRLGEDRAGMLMPWLDEMVQLSLEGNPVQHYLRMQGLWFQIANVIALYIKVSPVRLSRSQRAHIRPTLPRDRRFATLRTEVRHVDVVIPVPPPSAINTGSGARFAISSSASSIAVSAVRRVIAKSVNGSLAASS